MCNVMYITHTQCPFYGVVTICMTRHQKSEEKKRSSRNLKMVECTICVCVFAWHLYTMYIFLFVAFTLAEEMNLWKQKKAKQNDNNIRKTTRPHKHDVVHTFVYCGMSVEMSKYFDDGMQSFAVVPIASRKFLVTK